MVGNGSGELITPLVPSTQPAGSLQQVMSPTLGYGTAGQGTNVYGSTQTSGNAQPGGTGFEPSATGGVLEGAGQYEQTRSSGEASQVPTTTEGGILGAQGAHVPVQTPGGSSGLEASTGRLGTVSSDALPGGIVDAGDSHVEGFVTPRSQHGLQHQGLPTITEMVEGFPASGRQLMTRVGEFFRVARTEVMQVPTVWQDTHVTPPRSTSQSQGSLGAAPGHLALGEGSMGSHSSSTPQVGMPGTPTSFAPHPGRDSSSLLSPDVLQRMQALEQRAPLLYGYPPERPSSRSNSSSIPQEAIQAEVARQLASFDQRAQVQELEIQRLKRQLEDANQAAQRERAIREQVEREATLQRNVPQVAPNPAPQQPPVLEQAATPQVVQVLPQDAQVPVPITHQVQDVAAQAVEAFRAPAQPHSQLHPQFQGCCPTYGRVLEGCQGPNGISRPIHHPGGLVIHSPAMVAHCHQPHPGGMGMCHQLSSLRCPGPRFLRHQAQVNRIETLQEESPHMPHLLLRAIQSLMLYL